MAVFPAIVIPMQMLVVLNDQVNAASLSDALSLPVQNITAD